MACSIKVFRIASVSVSITSIGSSTGGSSCQSQDELTFLLFLHLRDCLVGSSSHIVAESGSSRTERLSYVACTSSACTKHIACCTLRRLNAKVSVRRLHQITACCSALTQRWLGSRLLQSEWFRAKRVAVGLRGRCLSGRRFLHLAFLKAIDSSIDDVVCCGRLDGELSTIWALSVVVCNTASRTNIALELTALVQEILAGTLWILSWV